MPRLPEVRRGRTSEPVRFAQVRQLQALKAAARHAILLAVVDARPVVQPLNAEDYRGELALCPRTLDSQAVRIAREEGPGGVQTRGRCGA